MKRTVLTYGTFDLFHVGHVNILRRARMLGDKLIVGVSTDEFNRKKGKKSIITFEDRCLILESCKYVDEIVPENSWDQKIGDIFNYNVDIFVMGDDWAGKFDYLSRYCKVSYLSRTDGISSSMIKDSLRISRT